MTGKSIVIVGAGFTGAYIGRNLAEQGWKVRIVEILDHIAGHMYDEIDEDTGCLVHKYGPHIFHTNDDDIWQWVNQFSEFTPFNLKTRVFFEAYQEWFTCSFGFHTIKQLFKPDKAAIIISKLKKEYPDRDKVTITELMESKDDLIKEFVNILWEEDYRPYTAKQWGLEPENVDPNILKRVPVYMSYFDKIHNDKYEALPTNGYTALFENILNHKNISVNLNTNALDNIDIIENQVYYKGEPSVLVYSGAIDEFFNYKHGYLGYRSLEFKREITINDKDTKSGDPCVDIYPDGKYDYTRITNYGKLPIQNHLDYQVSVKEYPSQFQVGKNMKRYYPISTEEDTLKLLKYKKEVETIKGLYLSGRLADYKYYDMDKALMAARDTLQKIIDAAY